VLISVIIPTYNRSSFLEDAINSVLKQTYSNFEVLVVDDHSTDDTKEVVNKFNDPRIKYLLNSRSKGAQGARNTGILAAKGSWIAFLDSDDTWHSEKLCKINSIITQITEDIGLIFDNNHIFNNRYFDRVAYRKVLLVNNVIGGFSRVCIRRSVFTKIGLLDETLSARQDIDTYYRVLEHYDLKCLDISFTEVDKSSNIRISDNPSKRIIGYEDMLDKYQDSYNVFSYSIILIRIIRWALAGRHYKKAIKYLFSLIPLILQGCDVVGIYHKSRKNRKSFYDIIIRETQI